MIVQLLVCTLAAGLTVHWLWQRRFLYAASWRMRGPIAWPLVGNALLFWDIPKIHTTIWHVWQNNGGSAIRFWLFQKFIVFVTNPAHLEFVMNAPQTADRGQVSTIIDDIIGQPGLFTARGAQWRHHRRCLNPTMHFKVVNAYYPIFNKWNHRLVEQLAERADDGATFDMFDYLDRATLCMICDTLFDLQMDPDADSDLDILHAVNNLMQNIGLKMYQPWYNIKPIFRISKYYDEFRRSIDSVDKFLRMLLSTRVEDNRARIADDAKCGMEEDVVNGKIPKPDHYLDHCLRLVEAKLMSFDEMIAETKTMLAGGFETTANTGAYIVLMLAMHPDLQQRVYDEMVDVLPHIDSPLLAEHVPRLKYTDRFIKETLRLFPVVPLASRYADEAATLTSARHKPDADPEPLHIPRGSEIILGIYYMQRDPRIWGDDADRFDPERFGADRMRDVHPYAFVPFSAGFHHCIGARYGQLVLRMFVAWLVRSYRFRTELRMEDLRFRMDITLKLLNGHLVRADRREMF